MRADGDPGLPGAGLRDRPAGAAPHPAQMTSHENALGWMRMDIGIISYRNIVNGADVEKSVLASFETDAINFNH